MANFQDEFNAEQRRAAYKGVLYVFEREAVEDRSASIKEGKLVLRDRDICNVYKPGDQATVVRWVIEDLAPEKLELIRERYEAWSKGQEEPVRGTSLRMWPPISKAQAENYWNLNIRTVEDLSAVPDNLLPNLGMGAQVLRQKARTWLESAGNIGQVAEQLQALTVRLGELETMTAEKDTIIEEQKAKILELSGEAPRRGPGRPRKEEAA
jgi:hypothetical protein